MHAILGKGHVEWDNPYDVGMSGLIGFSSGYYAKGSCDGLLMLGTDFTYIQFYPKNTRIEQVDIRPETSGRRTPIERRLIGDVRVTLQALLPQLRGLRDDKHLKTCIAHYQDARRCLDEPAGGKPGGRLHPQHIARTISELASDDAVFTCDGADRRRGQPNGVAMPPKVTAEMAKGFTLYMLRAVMSGRGDEVVELARSNLLR